jgi:hypothetical protein
MVMKMDREIIELKGCMDELYNYLLIESLKKDIEIAKYFIDWCESLLYLFTM